MRGRGFESYRRQPFCSHFSPHLTPHHSPLTPTPRPSPLTSPLPTLFSYSAVLKQHTVHVRYINKKFILHELPPNVSQNSHTFTPHARAPLTSICSCDLTLQGVLLVLREKRGEERSRMSKARICTGSSPRMSL